VTRVHAGAADFLRRAIARRTRRKWRGIATHSSRGQEERRQQDQGDGAFDLMEVRYGFNKCIGRVRADRVPTAYLAHHPSFMAANLSLVMDDTTRCARRRHRHRPRGFAPDVNASNYRRSSTKRIR
jgi:DNA polymerase III alpha subunit